MSHGSRRGWLRRAFPPVVVYGLTLLTLPGPLDATAAQVEAKRTELKDLRQRIDALRDDLGRNEKSRAGVADELKDTESAISSANRQLRELGEKRRTVEVEVTRLEQQSDALSAGIDMQQKQLAVMLYRRYLHGESDALQLLLSGEDPNRIAQDEYFLTALSRAKAKMLGQLRESLAQKQKLAEARRDKAEELAVIEQKQQAGKVALVQKQKERQAVLARIAGTIRTQRREIDTLKNDEKRLTRLIEGLSRIVRTPPTAKHRHTPPSEGSAPRVEATPEAGGLAYSGNFAALRGKLRLPLRGDITGRFGKPRNEGSNWKGLFIRSPEGTEVKAVAPGRVVFSDWLRGFGNLIIVDHGDGYLSVYGNNQSLFRDAGQIVAAGDTIAAAGSSGGGEESGLYFELRRQGQPFDPLTWASLR